MVVYDSVSADLSSDLLDTIQGSIEEKLLFLQDQLGDSFPSIVIQYVCGEETSIVQVKGEWKDVKNIHIVLQNWFSSVTGVKDDGTDDLSITEEDEEPVLTKDAVNIDKDIKIKKEKHEDNEVKFATNKEGEKEKVEDDTDQAVPLIDMCESCGKGSSPQKTTDGSTQTDPDSHRSTPNKKNFVQKKKSPIKRVTRPQRRKSAVQYKVEANTAFNDDEDDLTDTNETILDESLTGDGDQLLKNETNDFSNTEGNGSIEDYYDEEKQLKTYDEYVQENSSTKQRKRDSHGSNFSNSELDEHVDADEEVVEPVVIKNSGRGRKKKSDLFGQSKLISEDKVKSLISEIMDSVGGDSMEGKVDIPCKLCDYKTSAKRHLRAHILRCHVPQKNKCHICNKMYSLAKDLRSHLKTHYPDHSCNFCERKFPTKPILIQHIAKYHNPETERKRAMKGLVQKCEYCDYTNDQMKNVKDHMARHHQEKIYVCSMCPKKYALKKDMVAHEKTHTTSYQCEQCGKILHSKIAHKAHVNAIHLGIKNNYKKEHMCDNCGYICRSKTHYKEHMNKVHLNVKPYGCPLCKMAFYTNASLRSHLKTHTNDKHFTCEECGKAFKHRTSLKMHEMTHVGYNRRPFECSTCKKTFSQKGALMRHIRIHTGEKPYKCRLCDGAFSDYSILRRHMLGVHKVNSKNLCHRNDIIGNRGGPKPEKVIVEDVTQYKGVVRTPEERKDELQEEEQLLALVTKTALETQTVGGGADAAYKEQDPVNDTNKIQVIQSTGKQQQQELTRMHSVKGKTGLLDHHQSRGGSGGNNMVSIFSSAADLDDLKGIQPMNIVPISSTGNHSGSAADTTLYHMPQLVSHSMPHSRGGHELLQNPHGPSNMHEYLLEVKSDLSGVTGGYTVLQPGANTSGLGQVSGVSNLVNSGIGGLPFTVQTIPSQDGEPLAIQIIQGGMQ